MQRKIISSLQSVRALVVAFVMITAALATTPVTRALPVTDPTDSAEITLPTDNDGLYRNDDSLFYMETAVDGDQPWTAGKFGFVRGLRRTAHGAIYLRHHAGIDIRPLLRDRRGEPLDSVRSIADGTVVYVNDTAHHSNYGRYVVVEHRWGGSPYFSLYAHLSDVWAAEGQRVLRGEALARIGYTGAGINRRRAHLHLELALLVSDSFQVWFDRYYQTERNHHGIYSGLNLVSVDVARFLLRLHGKPTTTVPELVGEEDPFFAVTVPMADSIDLLKRYPWLLSSEPGPDDHSWRITFARHGLPLCVEPSTELVAHPSVAVIDSSTLPYRWLTKSLLSGARGKPVLSEQGRRWVELIAAPAGRRGVR